MKHTPARCRPAPTGSPCRTGKGKVAAQYHTDRFRLWNASTSTTAPWKATSPARKRGKTIGGATVADLDMLAMALHYRDQGLSLRDMAAKLVITTGKKNGRPPLACHRHPHAPRP
ncbi:hypothetical protein [Kitasatospora sp. NPDC087271]|uniref:zinc finger domain-containing protein n=1 Tax=Kitasatospora sp. NPDC087271 TaxID=3364067 RepID=UPI0037FAB85D